MERELNAWPSGGMRARHYNWICMWRTCEPEKKKYHPWDVKMVALTPNSRLWFVWEKLFWSLLNLLDSVTRNFTIVTNPKPITVNNDCARHKGLCGSGKGDLFHCKRPLFISKRKQASLIYMRKSEPTLSSPGITAHTSSERLTAFWRYAVLFSFLEQLY